MTFAQFKKRFQVKLDPQQEAAVQAARGPVLLLAVPGSGKTTVLIARLGYLIHCCGVPPENILTMTYTVAATREMQRRFAACFGAELAGRLEFRTINGVSARVIRCYEHMEGRTAFRLMTDEGERTALLAELYFKSTGNFAAESELKSLKAQITYVKNMQPAREQLESMRLTGSTVAFAPLYRAYCAVLREREWMDYDDQMVYAERILTRYPAVLEQMQREYLCVDEAQDTSRIQHRIIRLLAGRRPNLFLVGDEDQSIYGFRAAYPQALMEFETMYPDAQVLYLERNYRSTPQIVARAQGVIAHNADRRPKEMRAVRPDGRQVQNIPVADRAAQYRYLARVARDCADGDHDGMTAVLYRDNDTALPVIDLLERSGTPYRCRQLECTFFSHPVVRDVTDILRLAEDPTDSARFLRIYYKLNAGISKVQAQLAADEAAHSGRPVLDCLLELQSLSRWTERRLQILRAQLAVLPQDDGGRALWRVVNPMGYSEYLTQRGGDSGKLDILCALAAREPGAARVLERLDELRRIAARGGSGDECCGFVLSTIHSSKGLEYDRVFLADVTDGLLPGCDPSDDSHEGRAALQEERRLLYVGMTRARRELAIFSFQDPSLRSTFLEEVFPELANRRKEPTARKPAGIPDLTLDRGGTLARASVPPEFAPGRRVRHTFFGTGRVIAAQDGLLTLRLDRDGTDRRIAWDAAVQARALFPEEE
ncbi:MAG: ATP-dependent helicase [Gemmiger sp.]